MSPKVAAVTMAYNEQAYLPVWARHYARQVGADHCYVIDHGSSEIPNLPPGMNVLRLPRSPHDDAKRAVFVASFVASLLQYYAWVLHTDVDELVLADPAHHADLPAFCAAATTSTVTAIGFDIQHVPSTEAPLAAGIPIGAQRRWVRFTSAMCKPVLTRDVLAWAPGFHCANAPLAFSSLYLFHLHWADHAIGLARLGKTRTMPWGDDSFGAHQRITDAKWTAMFSGMAGFPRHDGIIFDPAAAPLSTWLGRTVQSARGREHDQYTIDLQVNAGELWAIPARFCEKL